MFAFLKNRLGLDDFHALLAQRSARWYAACLRITRDEGLAEDAVQEALLKAWDRRGDFRGEAELDTWIHRIALNAAIDLVRRRRDAKHDDDAALEHHEAAPEATPHAAYAARALAGDLDSALTRLTPMERDSFVLKHLEGWTLEEIAARLNTNVNNTKQALFRAVKKLRADLTLWRGEA